MQGSRFSARTTVLWLSVLLVAFSARPAPAAGYPPAGPGVEFAAVLALPPGPAPTVLPYGEQPQQFVELSRPAQGDGPFPVVVFIHGGCWLKQFDIGYSRALATALNQAGYAVWNIEYRRLGNEGGGWPGTMDDIAAALALLANEAPAGLNLDRVAIAGHSAGGHLGLLAPARAPRALTVRGVLGLAPITDIAHYATGEGSCNQAAAAFLDGLSDAQRAAANPALQPAPRGAVLLYGSRDRIVPMEVPFVAPDRLVTLAVGHFDWVHPGTAAFQRFLGELAQVLQ